MYNQHDRAVVVIKHIGDWRRVDRKLISYHKRDVLFPVVFAIILHVYGQDLHYLWRLGEGCGPHALLHTLNIYLYTVYCMSIHIALV